MERQEPSEHPVTLLLRQARSGDASARDRVTDLIHRELRRIAGREMRGEYPVTLQATGLVNEAYIELFGKSGQPWKDRNHFFAYAATVMRHILVREARRRSAAKRGGDQLRVTLEGLPAVQRDDELIALDEALEHLSDIDERKCRVVEMRFFGGLSIDDICDVLALSPASVHRELKAARGWLYHHLQIEGPDE